MPDTDSPPDRKAELATEALALRARIDELEEALTGERRARERIAAALLDEGFSQREAGQLLGISHQAIAKAADRAG